MKRVFVHFRLKSTEEGGRKQPLPQPYFGCPLFFKDVLALSAHAYDCRIFTGEYGRTLFPGDEATHIAMAFLSPEEVLPNMKPGVQFRMSEGKIIGEGTVLSVE